MKERPILFSGPMVRAILEGRKTQTRRGLTIPSGWQPGKLGTITSKHPKQGKLGLFIRREIHPGSGKFELDLIPCPYGKVGDRLWVRESWRRFNSADECACYDVCICSRMHGKPLYRATDDNGESKWKPSIHMPRWASRITVEITDIRVERLNEISEADAIGEGVEILPSRQYKDYGCRFDHVGFSDPKLSFRSLWQSIHSLDSWTRNPWVWVIEFKRVA